MPYKNVAEAIKKHPGLKNYSAKAQRGWYKSINQCFADGGKDDKCFPIAWSVANKVDGKEPKSKQATSLTQPLQTRPDYGRANMELELTLEEMETDLRLGQAKDATEDEAEKTEEDEKEARFEKGKPADPTKNMSPADKAKWQSEKEKNKDKFKKKARRKRLTTKATAQQLTAALDASWEKQNAIKTADETPAPSTQPKEATVSPAGLYGYTKAIQKDCETASRKLEKVAVQMAKQAFKRDERVAEFLGAHSKRAKSLPAKILVAAMKEIGPKIASEEKEAYACQSREASHSMYGFRTKTAQLGLQVCADIRNEAGRIASTLHRRRATFHEKITGFFKEHSKMAKCSTSRIILDCYPDATMKLGSEHPQSIEEILSWEG